MTSDKTLMLEDEMTSLNYRNTTYIHQKLKSVTKPITIPPSQAKSQNTSHSNPIQSNPIQQTPIPTEPIHHHRSDGEAGALDPSTTASGTDGFRP